MTIATKDGLAVIENGQTCPVVLKPKPIRRPIFLRAPENQWLDPERPICQNCLREAKGRAAEGYPKEPFRLTGANFADPGPTLPETRRFELL